MPLSCLLGCKTAYLLSEDDHPLLADMMSEREVEFWKLMTSLKFDGDWRFKGTDISGATGYVVVFETDMIPTQESLMRLVSTMEREEMKLEVKRCLEGKVHPSQKPDWLLAVERNEKAG
jgi:hypothetical protein